MRMNRDIQAAKRRSQPGPASTIRASVRVNASGSFPYRTYSGMSFTSIVKGTPTSDPAGVSIRYGRSESNISAWNRNPCSASNRDVRSLGVQRGLSHPAGADPVVDCDHLDTAVDIGHFLIRGQISRQRSLAPAMCRNRVPLLNDRGGQRRDTAAPPRRRYRTPPASAAVPADQAAARHRPWHHSPPTTEPGDRPCRAAARCPLAPFPVRQAPPSLPASR